MHLIRHPAFRWVITFILMGLMGYQLWSRSNHFETFRLISFSNVGWWIGIVFLLMPLNWCLEAVKWRTFLSKHFHLPFAFLMKAVACGVAVALFTPSRIGEYGGRILFMPSYTRWPAAISTLMGSIAQNLVALTFGVVSCIILFEGSFYLKICGVFLILIAGTCFFQMRRVLKLISVFKILPVANKLVKNLHYIEDYSPLLLARALGIALCRYLVYTVQFMLLLHAFEPNVHPGILFLGVSAVFLFQALVPLPPVADVLARTNVGLILWSGAGMSELSITLASLMVWLINLLIPAMIGSFIMGTIARVNSLHTHDQLVPSSYRPVITDQPTKA